ncbi:uncharacterized protein LOC124184327 [Neodiprion fabricii]|uniref:uncharacterized protein LOC124184327 n=2 Tax=Neodiprion TaxID=270857 RepID=UPI001ED9836E|nr:uncharacterized protein LOC124184327 [Neodiprion fabricii]
MVSKRVKYALAHLSRRQHMAMLARPAWRRLNKTDIHYIADPYSVHRSALKCHPSKRLRIMSQPRVVNKKFDPTKLGSSYPKIHPKTLNAKPSKRIVEMSLPKKRMLLITRKQFFENKTVVRNIDSILKAITKTRYFKYRILCLAAEQRMMAKAAKLRKRLHKALSKPEDWAKHKQTLERIAVPKVVPEPWTPDRGEKKSIEEMKDRLDILAQPVVKDSGAKLNPFSVKPGALKYQASERIKEIAVRKITKDAYPPKDPTAVSPAAIRAVPTPRILILAKPAARPPGRETDLKEDAFSVVPRALKAKCTARTKILAKPKSYGNST